MTFAWVYRAVKMVGSFFPLKVQWHSSMHCPFFYPYILLLTLYIEEEGTFENCHTSFQILHSLVLTQVDNCDVVTIWGCPLSPSSAKLQPILFPTLSVLFMSKDKDWTLMSKTKCQALILKHNQLMALFQVST